MAFFFSRDTKVFMQWSEDSTTANTALYEIPVLDGFSFSQGTNTSEITLSEAANSSGYSKRGRAMFTDSFAPAEWSFSTYMRPTVSGSNAKFASGDHADSGGHFAVEGPLWAAMSAKDYDDACGGDAYGDTAKQEFNFANSNQVTLGTFDMYFVLGAAKDTATALYATGTEGVTIYKLADCSVGSASIDFDIEGIAQVGWSGNGKTIEEAASLNTEATGTTAKGLIREGVDTTSNFIRQKLTDLSLTYDASETTGTVGALGSSDQAYSVTLTGGNITVENNISYLTPETIGTVNLPLGHVTGTRSVSGNFTCYLNDVSNGSLDLFEKLQESRGVITNAFQMVFSIGGSGNTPRCNVSIGKAHLELPTHDLSDVVSVDVAFHGLSTDLSSATAADATNEVKVTYVGA
jgi:hypothetical protein|tara:strand:+ start:1316 stop:2533 length:1218 start_codon:yes stop_codon:yes gene_type:complete